MGSKHFEKEKSKRNSTESQRPSYIRLTNADSVVPFKALSVRGINNRVTRFSRKNDNSNNNTLQYCFKQVVRPFYSFHWNVEFMVELILNQADFVLKRIEL